MNSFIIAKTLLVLLSLSYLSLNFFRNYYSPEKIEKRCLLKFEEDFKMPSETPREEWVLILDLADKNYLKFMGITQ